MNKIKAEQAASLFIKNTNGKMVRQFFLLCKLTNQASAI